MKIKDLREGKPILGNRYEFKHLYIRGNYQQDIFFDKVDFINAWNRIWLSAYYSEIEILAVEILSNHIHICIRYLAAENNTILSNFIHYLRMSLSLYFNYRYDVHGSLGGRKYGCANVVDADEDGGDDLRDLIRYIIRNVTHHGITDKYQSWPFGSYKLIFNLSKGIKYFSGKDIPPQLLHAYIPVYRKLPEEFSMAENGMLVPPPVVFPKNYIEGLFGDVEKYLKLCNIPTRRETSSDCEINERQLGRPHLPSRKINDQIIIDYIRSKSQIPIVAMDKKQCIDAIMDVTTKYQKVSLRQLSRIFHIPVGTIYYWLSK